LICLTRMKKLLLVFAEIRVNPYGITQSIR
jgi:hypothetical protein